MKKTFIVFLLTLTFLVSNSFYFSIRTVAENGAQLRPVYQKDIRAVMQNPKFKYSDPWAWWHRFCEWVEKFFKKYSIKRPAIDPTGEVLKWIGIGLALLLPFGVIFFWNRFFRKEKIVPEPSDNSDATIRKMEPRKIADQAEILASKGEYREAVRYLYIFCLERLKNNGTLPEGITLSDNENLRSARRAWGITSETYKVFQAFVSLFQEKWYGLYPCSINDYQLSVQYIEQIGIKR